tara:strand:- start:14400 stop:14789 length:390 start_codon:yes stop_codon:yes gene_type:complete
VLKFSRKIEAAETGAPMGYIYKVPHECIIYEDEQRDDETAEEFIERATAAWREARHVAHNVELEAFEEWKTIRALAGDTFADAADQGVTREWTKHKLAMGRAHNFAEAALIAEAKDNDNVFDQSPLWKT